MTNLLDSTQILSVLNILTDASNVASDLKNGFIVEDRLSIVKKMILGEKAPIALKIEELLNQAGNNHHYKYSLKNEKNQHTNRMGKKLVYNSTTEIEVEYVFEPVYGIANYGFLTVKANFETKEIKVEVTDSGDQTMNDYIDLIAQKISVAFMGV